jgi:hypothetical protein
MLVLRCTTKAFKKIGMTPRRIDVSEDQPTFGEWYVNTVDVINEGNLLACMHAESLYVLLVPVQPPASVDQLVTGLQTQLLNRLIELETPPEAAKRVVDTYRDKAILAKTSDRRMTGHLNSILQDLEYILGDESSGCWDGNKLLGPKVEHHLNTTPRGTSSSNATIWPLSAFWECVRKLCPALPRRATLRLFYPDDKALLQRIGKVLYDNLPEHLAGKLFASLQEVDVLYSAEELQTLADAMDERPDLHDSLISKYNSFVRNQVTVKLERLLGQRE